MMNDESLMSDEQAGEAVARYFEENPELLDEIAPSHDLWPAIGDRISARILPIETAPVSTRDTRGARGTRRGYGWAPMLIAASALVATSAGITYELTTRRSAPAAQNIATENVVAAHAPVGTTTNKVGSSVPADVAPHGAAGIAVTGATNAGDSHSSAGAAPQGTTRPASRLASTAPASGGDQMRSTYDAEIATLHDALAARRSQLNPATVAIIEQNLRVINEAIRQSRAALAKDPNSRLLNDQLDRTLAKKTGLLRVAALLPAA